MDEVSFGCNKYRCSMGGNLDLIDSGEIESCHKIVENGLYFLCFCSKIFLFDFVVDEKNFADIYNLLFSIPGFWCFNTQIFQHFSLICM